MFHYRPSILGYPHFWKHPYIFCSPCFQDITGIHWLAPAGWRKSSRKLRKRKTRSISYEFVACQEWSDCDITSPNVVCWYCGVCCSLRFYVFSAMGAILLSYPYCVWTLVIASQAVLFAGGRSCGAWPAVPVARLQKSSLQPWCWLYAVAFLEGFIDWIWLLCGRTLLFFLYMVSL